MKVAVVLFNLGGPDSPAALRPFLRNLFSDPAIIAAPTPLRWLLARWISFRRAPVAREIYSHLGGKSPLLELTRRQASALQDLFPGPDQYETFVCMRYWHPMSGETVEAVKKFGPDRIVLLPLYPQFSTTTTGSSLADWRLTAKSAGLDAPTAEICCYPEQPGFIAAIAGLVEGALSDASAAKGAARPRVLFSAHGLPQKIVDGGDPYTRHVERTAAAVVEKLNRDGLDWVVCYQSRVGRLQWTGPATLDEIARAAKDRVPVVVVPVAFVSEHSETLVELDMEYRGRAVELGVPAYHRVATVGTDDRFICGLKQMVDQALAAIIPGDKGKTVTISSPVGGCPDMQRE